MLNPQCLTCVLLTGCTVLFAGCGREKSQPAPANPAAATPDSSVPDSSASGATQLALLADVPEFLLTGDLGLPFGNRELHGRLTLFVLSPKEPDAADAAERLAESLESQWDAPWFRRLQVVRFGDSTPAPAARKRGIYVNTLLGDSALRQAFVAALHGEDLAAAGDQDELVVVIDPVGRIRARHTVTADIDKRLVNDLHALWQEQVPVIAEVLDTPWLTARRDAQLRTADSIQAQHEFSFTDQQPESGIRFLHQIVDDAGRDYKGVHYDHGNGVIPADVDSDGLIDLYFVNQLGRNALYRNIGDGRFSDITDSAGVAVGDRIGVSAAFGDIDNDGDADLFVTSVRKGNLLFRNDGRGKFEDITEASRLNSAGHCSAAVFFDYNRDGRLDLLVTHVGRYTTDEQGRGDYYIGYKDAFSGHLKPERTEPSRLFRNVDGTTFDDVTEAAGLTDRGWTGDAIVLDGNRDGWPDLYLPNMQGNDQYFENQAGQTFLERAEQLFPKTPFGSMGVAVTDFDNDLDLDLFVTDMHSDMAKDILADYRSEVSLSSFHEEEKLKALNTLPESMLKTNGRSLFGNAFYRNDGPDQFAEISDQIGVENYWPWGVSTGDLNADGFEDLFIASSMNYPYRYAVNSLLLNENGQRFRDAEFVLGVEPRREKLTAQPWFTLDTPVGDDERLEKILEGRSGRVVVWGALGSRSSVIVDIDNDGDLDIITGEFNDVPMVLVSDLAQRQTVNHLKVVLEGRQSNRQGLGAEVLVQAGGRKFLKSNHGQTGYLAHGAVPLYFGLGDATTVDAVEVRWPSGRVQVIPGPLPSGQLLRIREE